MNALSSTAAIALLLLSGAEIGWVSTAVADDAAPDPSARGSARSARSRKVSTPRRRPAFSTRTAPMPRFGRYTGIDHNSAYAVASASGQVRSADGDYANYDLEQLGLASREGYVEGGREGQLRLARELRWPAEPSLRHGCVAPYQVNGSSLTLPASWVTAGSTQGMSALNGSLSPLRIGSERQTTASVGPLLHRVRAGRYRRIPASGARRHGDDVGELFDGGRAAAAAFRLRDEFL
jgi:hypothetical protein